eukprot:5290801-Pyramimonas_sp.AAC.1
MSTLGGPPLTAAVRAAWVLVPGCPGSSVDGGLFSRAATSPIHSPPGQKSSGGKRREEPLSEGCFRALAAAASRSTDEKSRGVDLSASII